MIDWTKLYQVSEPGVEEKLCLDLSVAIEARKNPKAGAISCASQKEAADYINEHGFEAGLDRLLELEG